MMPLCLPQDKTTLILSDTHILMPNIPRAKIEAFITENDPEVLVLAGDTFDFYYAHFAKQKEKVLVDEAEAFMTFLAAWLQANLQRQLVVLYGNHDASWNIPHMVQYVPALKPLWAPWKRLMGFAANNRMKVGCFARLGDTLITHGHHGIWGDWLWYLAKPRDKARGGVPVPRLKHPLLLQMRHKVVVASGFYLRLALWGKIKGFQRIIHGHVHNPLTLTIGGVEVWGLPSWRPDEHAKGGGIFYNPHTQTWSCLKAA